MKIIETDKRSLLNNYLFFISFDRKNYHNQIRENYQNTFEIV